MKALAVAVSLLVASSALATPENWETYKKFYGLKPGMTNFKAGCMNCHTAGRNGIGPLQMPKPTIQPPRSPRSPA